MVLYTVVIRARCQRLIDALRSILAVNLAGTAFLLALLSIRRFVRVG